MFDSSRSGTGTGAHAVGRACGAGGMAFPTRACIPPSHARRQGNGAGSIEFPAHAQGVPRESAAELSWLGLLLS